MAIIKSAYTDDGLLVDATSKAIRVTPYNKNGTPMLEGKKLFSVALAPVTIEAAGLAVASTHVIFSPGTIEAHITRLRLHYAVATVGVSGGVPGTVAWVRCDGGGIVGAGTLLYPTNRRPGYDSSGSGRILAATLTVTTTAGLSAPGLYDVIASTLLPVMTAMQPAQVWECDFSKSPLVVPPGAGLEFRVLTALAATQTWVFGFSADWFEV